MTGIPTEVALHKLSLDPNIPPVRQKKCSIAEARNKFVKEEVYGIFETKKERMQQYVVKVQARSRKRLIISISRKENAKVDALANLDLKTEIKGSEFGTVVQLMHSVLDADSYYEVLIRRSANAKLVDLLWENIICRFGIPKEIAFDNGPQFIGAMITKFLEDLKIKRITSSPYHPSANGQAESTKK
ncbi:PREDICTED: uncharacterized protein LOC109244489 [Nicotiana attenuata]|uniref:uncharacterized protein LOC109244489 n=1 Tax=Nicotiana attenuata TaxID=49451 RepID=UPI000904A4A1|nr:PREDICTED: uncharacterized protein LOC109244489 [Nicotiana attenuata]